MEGNNLTGNGIGMTINGADNIIIKNTVSDSVGSNYEIVADNKVGVIVNAPPSPAIDGNVGGAGVGTTDPWANISY